MATRSTHTVPNNAIVQTVLGKGHQPMQCIAVRRDSTVLALYPAAWTNNRIPPLSELMRDARWVKPVLTLDRAYANYVHYCTTAGLDISQCESKDVFAIDFAINAKTGHAQCNYTNEAIAEQNALRA